MKKLLSLAALIFCLYTNEVIAFQGDQVEAAMIKKGLDYPLIDFMVEGDFDGGCRHLIQKLGNTYLELDKTTEIVNAAQDSFFPTLAEGYYDIVIPEFESMSVSANTQARFMNVSTKAYQLNEYLHRNPSRAPGKLAEWVHKIAQPFPGLPLSLAFFAMCIVFGRKKVESEIALHQ